MNGPTARLPVRVLSFHAGYLCRSSGACCSSDWEIPVEPDTEESLLQSLRQGTLVAPAALRGGECLQARAGLPHGARAVLSRAAGGRCVFLEPGPRGLCAVHRQLGEAALPSACRHFPRVVTLTPLGVSITLSHYGPTAVGLLFDHPPAGGAEGATASARIVADPPAFPGFWPYEGLDARESLPPLLRPGVLMSWPAHERWEAHAVATLGQQALAPEDGLLRLAAEAERVRTWTPAEGDFDTFLGRCLAAGSPRPARTAGGEDLAAEVLAWEEVASTIPFAKLRPPSPRSVLPAGDDDPAFALVDAEWGSLEQPIRRWLAAKAFASWLTLQGEGLRTSVFGLRVFRAVLRAESARGCAEAGRRLDAALLREAFRRADLLLLHLVDPAALARRLSRCETPAGGPLWRRAC